MLYDRNQFDDSLLDNEPLENDNNINSDDSLDNHTDDTEGEGTEDNEEGSTEDETDDNLTALESFLKSRGIRDGKTIVYEDEETGETKELDFSDLDKKEQLEILNSLSDPGLSKDEVETINFLRKNNASLQDVIAFYQQKAIDDYIEKNNVHPSYSVDEYSDDELYIADQKAKYPEMSDEELNSELEIAKSNEELFKKKVDLIRKNYQEMEKSQAEEREQEELKKQEEYQKMFAETLNDFDSISLDYKDPKSDRLILEDTDKNLIFDYVFKPTTNGVSKFVEDLSNPETIAKLAWFRLFGEDTISDISNYWKEELKKAKRTTDKPRATVVPKQNTQEPDNRPKYAKNEKTISSA